jgi:SAGA-associated factor 29
MWNKIIQDLRKAKEKNDKQKALGEQIATLNEKIAKEGNSKCISFPTSFLVNCKPRYAVLA